MVYSIEQIKEKIAPVALKYNLPAVYIFGSYARGEATENSDVDVLVDIKGSTVKGWIMGGLYNDLCEIFGENTDIVTVGALNQDNRTPWFTENIMRERVQIYGQQ